MKKILYIFGIFSISALAFSACQKELPTDNNQPEKKLVTVTFSAEKVGTKTAAVEGDSEVSFVWTDEDVNNMKLFFVGTEEKEDNGETTIVEKLTQVSNPTITKVSDTKLTISTEVEPNATYTFRAVLSGDWTGSGNDYSSRSAKIKASQSPNGIANFDPSADILVSDDLEVEVGDEASTDDLLMSFHRKVVVNKMTLKNLVAGEKVSKVVITSLTGEIQGYYKNYSEMSGQSKVITLHYDNVVVPDNGEFPVYFISMNNTGISLKVDVTTDQFTYTKSFAEGKSIDLNLGQFTKFGMVLPNGTPVVDVPNGDYFITGAKSSQVYAAKAYASGNNLSSFAISLDTENEEISFVTDIEDCIFTFTRLTEGDFSGKYTIKDANGLYLYAAGGNGSSAGNQLKGEANPDNNGNAYWTVEANSDGTYSIESAGNASSKIMRFNNSNTPYVFSCYGSGQTPVTLYPASWCTIDTTPIITIEDAEKTKNVLSAATSVVFSYSANRYAQDPSVQIATDPDGIIDGNPVVNNGQIIVALNPNTDNSQKTATLTVSGTGLVGSPVTLTINQEAYENLVPGAESFDLTKNTYTTGTNSVTWSGTSAVINNSGNNATNYLGGDGNNRTSSRFYSGNTLTITPATGYTITSIVFTAVSTNYATVLGNSSWNNGSASVSSSTVTVTPSNGKAAITATISGTCGFTSIVVNYLTAGSGGDTINPVTVNTFANTATITGSDETQTATWVNGDVTVSAVKGESSTAFRSTDTNVTRFYSGWTITVSSAENTISSLNITCESASYATTLAGMSFSKGSAVASSDVVNVTGVSSSSTSVTLTAQVRIKSITVNYE